MSRRDTTASERVQRTLRENGPTTRKEIPADRPYEANCRSFAPSLKTVPRDRNGHGTSRTVYYLPNHDKADVLDVWLEANADGVAEISNWAIYQRINNHFPEFSDAASSALGPFTVGDGGGDANRGGECPLCGSEFDNTLPHHLENDCEGA